MYYQHHEYASHNILKLIQFKTTTHHFHGGKITNAAEYHFNLSFNYRKNGEIAYPEHTVCDALDVYRFWLHLEILNSCGRNLLFQVFWFQFCNSQIAYFDKRWLFDSNIHN